jgi:hypothetical protein
VGGAGVVRSRLKTQEASGKMDCDDMDLFTNGSATPSTDLTNGLGVGNCLAGIGLTKALLDFCQEAEPFDGILKGGSIRKPFHNLKDLLLDCFSGHRNHLVRLVL